MCPASGRRWRSRSSATATPTARFPAATALLSVPRLGNKVFQQAAGFLRVRGGRQPLDNSAVHPESYYVVEKMARAVAATPASLVGNTAAIRKLDPRQFVDERVGLPTIADIIAELEKPGRDPRQEFRVPQFAEGVHEIGDLREGMILEGVVTNVTRFGAFVDVGVHQDGLVHVSELDHRFIKDPTEVVAVGNIIRVKVLQVDLERRRIALSRKQAGSCPRHPISPVRRPDGSTAGIWSRFRSARPTSRSCRACSSLPTARSTWHAARFSPPPPSSWPTRSRRSCRRRRSTGRSWPLPPELHVAGNRLETADGKAVWLQGLCVDSLEWSAGGEKLAKSIPVAIDQWKANVIRLPVKDNFWFGGGPWQKPGEGGLAYRKFVDAVIADAASRGAYVALDLHGFGAPMDEDVAFWKDAATRYKNHPAVLFELFNEPHDISWKLWRDGGNLEDPKNKQKDQNPAENKIELTGETSPGMQGLWTPSAARAPRTSLSPAAWTGATISPAWSAASPCRNGPAATASCIRRTSIPGKTAGSNTPWRPRRNIPSSSARSAAPDRTRTFSSSRRPAVIRWKAGRKTCSG